LILRCFIQETHTQTAPHDDMLPLSIITPSESFQ